MSNQKVREFMQNLPPGVRQKVAQSMNNEAATKNAAHVADAFATAADAVINLGVVALVNAHDDAERELVHRSTIFSTVVIKTCEQILLRMVPDGPRQAMHDMMSRNIDASIPIFDEAIRKALPEGIAARERMLAARATNSIDPNGGSTVGDA